MLFGTAMFSINFKSWAFLVFALSLKWVGGWNRMDGGFVVGMCLLKGWLAASVPPSPPLTHELCFVMEGAVSCL